MITVEAKRLSGIDRGKQISLSLENPERHYTGKLWSVEHTGTYETRIKLHKDGKTFAVTVTEEHHIRIEGLR